MRLLLIGKNGQIGWELHRQLEGFGEVIATGSRELDLSNTDEIRDSIRRIRPALILNAAAYTAVDQAEKEPDLAMALNGTAPGILAEEGKKIGAAMIHYSTDYVFDGAKNTGAYVEEDAPNPQSVYGRTKLAGEQAIVEQDIPHLILRTSWIYGSRGKNFLLTILRLAGERKELKIVSDQTGAPTWCQSIAKATRQIISQLDDADAGKFPDCMANRSGIYHLSCAGQTSWSEFAKTILEFSNLTTAPNVVPITTSEYPTPAARPKYSVLSNAKMQQTFGIEMPDWKAALKECMNRIFPVTQD